MESCSAYDDLKDSAEDSGSESGSSSDNLSDWVPLYRPHFSNHGNQPHKTQLSNTQRASQQDKGEKIREGGKKRTCVTHLLKC